MKKAIALLLALVTLLSLTACAGKEDTASSALDQIKQKGDLVVGTSADYPPYEFHTEVDGKDTIVGFDCPGHCRQAGCTPENCRYVL